MGEMRLSSEGEIRILTLGSGENRLNADFLAEVNGVLDRIESSPEAAALVTTAEGKFFSNGFDLEWMSGLGAEAARAFLVDTQRLWARLLAFPVPTVAAINGHAFGAGAVHALAHDLRVMRTERGFLCFPEVDLQLRFRPGMLALVQARLGPAACRDAVLSGARYDGEQAQACGIVDEAVPLAALRERALARVSPLCGKNRATFAAFKEDLYGSVLQQLRAGS